MNCFKSMKAIMIIIVLLFIGCIPTHDDELEISGFSKSIFSRLVEGNEGIYIFPDNLEGLLYYWDTENGGAIPLCGKADCSHDNVECNAYFESPRIHTLERYQDKIYVWGRDSSLLLSTLYSVDLDGSNRQEICIYEAAEGIGTPWASLIYEDYMYMIVDNTVDSMGYRKNGIYRMKIDGSEKAECIYFPDDEWPEHQFNSMFADNGYLYFEDSMYSSEDSRCDVFRYDISAGELSTIYTNDTWVSFVVKENELICSKINPEVFQFEGLYVYDMASGEGEKVMEEGGHLTYDGEYLYVSTPKGYSKIYNDKLEYVDTFDAGEEYSAVYLSESYCYCIRSDYSSAATRVRIRLFDKADIGKQDNSYIEFDYQLDHEEIEDRYTTGQ